MKPFIANGHNGSINKNVKTLFLSLEDKILIGQNWATKTLTFFLEKVFMRWGNFLEKPQEFIIVMLMTMKSLIG